MHSAFSTWAAVMLASTLFLGPANAQVFKCKDPSGHVTYSNMGCNTGQSGRAVMREPTFEEKVREREQAYVAEQAKQDRLAREEMQSEMEFRRQQQQQAMELRYAAQNPQPRHKGYEERLAERNATVKPNLVPYHEAERQRRVRAATRPIHDNDLPHPHPPENQWSGISHCKGKWCYDNSGTPHAMGSNGSFTTGNGQVCKQKGDKVICF